MARGPGAGWAPGPTFSAALTSWRWPSSRTIPTGIVEKVVIEVYRRSAKGEEIAEWYEALLSKHHVSYEGREGGFGWHASVDCLQMVFHRLAPATLNPVLE